MGLLKPLLAALVLFVGALPAQGQGMSETVHIHGFAGWGWGSTDGNSYQFGTEDGDYKNLNYALNLSTKPSENLTIVGQVEWRLIEDDVDTEIDFVFAEWMFSDSLRLRLGQVKQPFGIYTEVFTVGTIRPFLELPQGFYGPAGFVAESYRGIGIVGSRYADSNWGFEYDLYFGEIVTPLDHPLLHLPGPTGQVGDYEINLDYGNVFGGRLVARTPVAGLSFGLSGFTGQPNESASVAPEIGFGLDSRRTVFGAYLEYLSNAWWVRSEYAFADIEKTNFSAYYAEVAYKFTENWQIAGLFDWSDIDLNFTAMGLSNTFWEHKDLGLTVNYWFSPHLVVKCEIHEVEGNRYAALEPEDLAMAMFTGRLDPKTRLFQIGAQFSF